MKKSGNYFKKRGWEEGEEEMQPGDGLDKKMNKIK